MEATESEKVFQQRNAFIIKELFSSGVEGEAGPLGKGRGKCRSDSLTLLDRVRTPLTTLRTVDNPFFRFPFTRGADEEEVGSSAQFESLLEFLGRSTEVFFMEVNLSQKPVKGWKVLYP